MTPLTPTVFGSSRWLAWSFGASCALLGAFACGGRYSSPGETSARAGSSNETAGGPQGGALGASGSPGAGAPQTIGGAAAAGSGGANTAGAPSAGAAGSEDSGGSGGGNAASPSCVQLPATCGPAGNGDCCAASEVPAAAYIRHANGKDFPATVSDFVLDRYEITVGRFRNFLAVYSPQMIAAGAGKNPHNPADTGWDSAWDASLPPTPAALREALACGDNFQTWSDAPGQSSENLPLTCMSWFEAEAFCIWDNGRLPTDAEWTLAASAGTEQRLYPWGKAEPDCSFANYYGAADGTDFCVLPGVGAPNPVGSESPKGDGKWGHADLGGNISEWMQDYAHTFPSDCHDCAALSSNSASGNRLVKGGSFAENAQVMTTRFRVSAPGAAQVFGARCARASTVAADTPQH